MPKVSWKEIFAGFQFIIFDNNAKLDKFYGICLVITKEMAQI